MAKTRYMKRVLAKVQADTDRDNWEPRFQELANRIRGVKNKRTKGGMFPFVKGSVKRKALADHLRAERKVSRKHVAKSLLGSYQRFIGNRSAAAKKAWDTRRKKYGPSGSAASATGKRRNRSKRR